jgi:acyl carrier protein
MKNLLKKEILLWFKKKNIIINNRTDFFSSSKIDSFGFIELLLYIEKICNKKIDHESLFLKKKLTLKDLILIIKNSENSKVKKK